MLLLMISILKFLTGPESPWDGEVRLATTVAAVCESISPIADFAACPPSLEERAIAICGYLDATLDRERWVDTAYYEAWAEDVLVQVNQARTELGRPPSQLGTAGVMWANTNLFALSDTPPYMCEALLSSPTREAELAPEVVRWQLGLIEQREYTAREKAERQERAAALLAQVEARGFAIEDVETRLVGPNESGEPVDLTYLLDADTPFTGEARRFREDATLEHQSNIRDGKLQGLLLSFHPNGMLSSRANLRDSWLTGLEEMFDEAGTLYHELCLNGGRAVGGARRPDCIAAGLPVWVDSLSRYVAGGEDGYPSE